MADTLFNRLVRCWHAQAVQLADLLEEGEGAPGWDDAVAVYSEAGGKLSAPVLQVAARRAGAAAKADRVRYARALRGAATRAARDAVASRGRTATQPRATA